MGYDGQPPHKSGTKKRKLSGIVEQNAEGDSANESSNEEIVYDEREGDSCLVDDDLSHSEELLDERAQRAKSTDAFSKTKIKCVLRPTDDATSKYLLEKSSNNINPYVIVETEAGTKVKTLISHMGAKLFKEDASKFLLRVH